MDSHHKRHIAHKAFWTNKQGGEPTDFMEISNKDVKNKLWFPRDVALQVDGSPEAMIFQCWMARE